MPKILNIIMPAAAKHNSTAAVVQQATLAVRSRSSGVSVGVIARNAGAVATGSTITNSELAASKVYSVRFTC